MNSRDEWRALMEQTVRYFTKGEVDLSLIRARGDVITATNVSLKIRLLENLDSRVHEYRWGDLEVIIRQWERKGMQFDVPGKDIYEFDTTC